MKIHEELYGELYEKYGDDITGDQLDKWATETVLSLPDGVVWQMFKDSDAYLCKDILGVYAHHGNYHVPLNCVLATWACEFLGNEDLYAEYVYDRERGEQE